MSAPSERADLAMVKFGQWCFEQFWNDACPCDIDGGEAQAKARELGLLRGRAEGDGECECGETDPKACECSWPTVPSQPVETWPSSSTPSETET